MPSLPTGTVTFLFTDIEGSTRLVQQLTDAHADVLVGCRRLVCAAVQERSGREAGTQGYAVLAAFPSAREALLAAIAAQQAILRHPWPDGAAMKVRMGLHTGEACVLEDEYVGLDVHRTASICAAAHGGQILVSRAVGDLVARDLPAGVSLRDLGEHRLKDLNKPEHLFHVVHPELVTEFPSPKSLDARPNNLPIQLTSFIGRVREIAEVKQLLGTARLVTLTGSGGAGKTRLALEVAANVVADYTDGAWLAEFAPIADPGLVPKTVASALNVPEQPGRDMTETLVDALRAERLLLVLDNCEHLLVACRELAMVLLRRCSQVHILATSREGLGVSGESLWPVPSLPVPEDTPLPPPERLVLYDGVRLFVDRATLARPAFAITACNAPAVVQVCRRLDGIPLAIELAAACVKVLSVERIAERLDDRFRLLTGGSRMALRRHQTLRAAMDWSYDLLSVEERALLRRLAVFAGGFDLEAAEAICPGDGVEPDDVLDLLTNLVGKSLVLVEVLNGGIRYRLLETIRQYGSEKLEDSGQIAELRGRHMEWYLVLAERVEPELYGPDQLNGLDELEREHDNFRAALDWAASGARYAEARLRLTWALHRFWSMRGHLTEGRAWLEGAIAEGGNASLARVKALYGTGVLAFDQGDYPRAEALLEQSLALSRERGDQVSTALALNHLALVHRNRGDYPRAITLLEESEALCRATGQRWVLAEALYSQALAVRRLEDYDRATALLEESLPLWQEAGDKSGLARSFGSLGVVARLRGDFARAKTLHEKSLALHRELGHKSVVADALLDLGLVAKNEGDYARATALYEECLILSRQVGNKLVVAAALVNLANVSHYQGDDNRASELAEEAKTLLLALGAKQQMAVCLWTLGNVAFARGDGEDAIAMYRESLTLHYRLGDRRGIAECLEALANVMAAANQADQAARLLGAAEALREAIIAPVPREDRPAYDRSRFAIQDLLSKQALSAAWTEGRAMTLEQAIEYALADRPG